MTEENTARSALEPPPPRKPKEKPPKAVDELDPDAWMVTFSDLLTLLMTFFVLIFASADPVEKAVQEAFGQRSGVFGLYRHNVMEQVLIVPRQDLSEDRLQVFLDEVGALDIEVEQEEQGLVVTLPTDAYFLPNSAQLNGRAVRRIGELADFLRATAHQIRVEGHTDDLETGAPSIRSNWELSLARGGAVLQQLLKSEIRANRLSLVGYGAVRPRFDNVSREGRQRNRRVEIVILNRRQ